LAKFSKNAAKEYDTPKMTAKQTKVAQTTTQALRDSMRHQARQKTTTEGACEIDAMEFLSEYKLLEV
jgi:hypothetical protein